MGGSGRTGGGGGEEEDNRKTRKKLLRSCAVTGRVDRVNKTVL